MYICVCFRGCACVRMCGYVCVCAFAYLCLYVACMLFLFPPPAVMKFKTLLKSIF